MADPYTIRIYVPDGDPEGVRIIDRFNWTGRCIVFPRDKWPSVSAARKDVFEDAGVYLLVGYAENEELPVVYIGQADGIGNRIDQHFSQKDFWNWGLAFISTSGLNRAHILWLEYALVERAKKIARCTLDNGQTPQEPALSESERADCEGFMREILQILPLVGLKAFETPQIIKPAKTTVSPAVAEFPADVKDTIVVPALEEGFRDVFLGEDKWRAIRISGGMLPKLKWIAAYQSKPISAVTHIAEIDHIEPYGDSGKYQVVFKGPAKPIPKIDFGNAPSGTMQGPRYTSHTKLLNAKVVPDLF